MNEGTRFTSIQEFLEALARWLDETNDQRLADTKYGGTAWLYVDTPLGTVTINADTRRDAISSLVAAVRQDSDLTMRVGPSRTGRLNKVTFDGCQSEGWYAYVDPPVSSPTSYTIR